VRAVSLLSLVGSDNSRFAPLHRARLGPPVSLIASGKIAPAELVDSLIQLAPAQMSDLPFGPLVVRAPDDDDRGKFLERLVDCVMKDAPVPSEPGGYQATAEFPTMRIRGREPSEADQVELLAELAAAPHCIVPLRGGKRTLTLGRAANSDIVLADPSISGQHARILLEDGGVRVADASSKNGTTMNGQRLSPEELPWLQPMDHLTFGRIEAYVCDPRALRGVLRQDLRTLL